MQLINAIPLNWKTIIKHNCSSASLLLLNHHLIKKNNLISLDKLHCRELYNILVYTSPHKPTTQVYFDNLFREQELNWKEIYIPVGICLLKVNNRNTRTRCEICSKLTIKTPERVSFRL